jgi:phosphoglucomutase
MVRELCKVRSNKVEFADCLTGFKWIANESIKRRLADPDLVHLLGYEEAIGYQLTCLVPDKDGLSAACVWSEMACYWKSKHMTLKERFDQILQEEIGYFATNNGYYLIEDPSITSQIFQEFRTSNATHPGGELGGLRIRSIRDVTHGTDTSLPASTKSHLPATPEAEMITISFENGAVVTIRASGTEPKVKYYSEMSSRESIDTARDELQKVVNVIKQDFYKPHKFSIKEQPVM